MNAYTKSGQFPSIFLKLLNENEIQESSQGQKSGLENIFWTYSSCGASGLNFSLVLTLVELVLKSGILKETKHIIQKLIYN